MWCTETYGVMLQAWKETSVKRQRPVLIRRLHTKDFFPLRFSENLESCFKRERRFTACASACSSQAFCLRSPWSRLCICFFPPPSSFRSEIYHLAAPIYITTARRAAGGRGLRGRVRSNPEISGGMPQKLQPGIRSGFPRRGRAGLRRSWLHPRGRSRCAHWRRGQRDDVILT